MSPLTENLRHDLVLYGREARAQVLGALRTPQFLIPGVLLPIGFYALFGVALAGDSGPRAQWLLATYAVFAALGPSIFGFGVYVATERETGLIALRRVSPLPPLAYVTGKLAASLTAGLMSLAGIAAVAAWAGVSMPAWRWAAVAGVGAASAIPFALIGMNLGLRLGTQAATAAANLLFMALSVLGGLWIPLALMPKWMSVMAWILPSYHLGQLSLMGAGMVPGGQVWLHLLILTAMTALAAAGAWAGWRREGA